MRFDKGDTVEFELAPDGRCSRWTVNGRTDRGASGNWRQGKVVLARNVSFNTWRYVVEAEGETYRFEISGIHYAGASSYPSQGIRKISSVKKGAVRLVDKGGHYETEGRGDQR